MSVPNQLIIVVNKEKTDKAHFYTAINLEALDYAVKRLKNSSFKLWMYLAKNQTGYRFELSRTAFCNWSGLSVSAYQDSIKVLKEEGFLVPCETSKNLLTFYEMPNVAKDEIYTIIIPEQKKKEIKETREEWTF